MLLYLLSKLGIQVVLLLKNNGCICFIFTVNVRFRSCRLNSLLIHGHGVTGVCSISVECRDDKLNLKCLFHIC